MSAPAQKYLAPGDLRADHALEDLSCSSCHEPLLGVPDKKCVRCHRDIVRARLRRHGGHAGMIGACVNCHVSHKIPGAAGIHVDADSVDHTRMRFSMEKHEDISCSRCHGKKFTSFNERHARRCALCHLGLKKKTASVSGENIAFAASKSSKNVGRHIRAVGYSCLKCHKGGARLKYKHSLELKEFFTAKHTQAECKACHKNDQYSFDVNACESCHSTEHGPDYSDKCTRCHARDKWKPTSFDHAGSDCSECHSGPSGHALDSCARCHNIKDWKPIKYNHANLFGGLHLKLDCAACHKENRYSGLSWTCQSCHQTSHGAGYSTNCLTCHNQSSWKTVSMNHAGVTLGCVSCHSAPAGHYSGGCEQCHKASSGWTANFNHPSVKEHSYKSFACTSCHPAGYGSVDCNSCHRGGAESENEQEKKEQKRASEQAKKEREREREARKD